MKPRAERWGWSLGVAAAGACLLASMSAAPRQGAKITGTFSDMHWVEEGGDVLGTEVRIVVGRNGYQAAVQVAEGAPGDLMVVSVWSSGDSVRFALPDSARFEGRVSSKFLRGRIVYQSGSTEAVKLTRRESYWD